MAATVKILLKIIYHNTIINWVPEAHACILATQEAEIRRIKVQS
jgi:hypothetical protein